MGPSLVVSIIGWAVGIQKHPDSPIILIHCQDVKNVPQPSGMRSWITTPPPASAPTVHVLGASTVAHTSQGSPSVDVLPPDEGVVLADVDSAGVQSASGSQESGRSRMDVDGLSSPFAQTTAPSDGCRNSGMKMECWPVGTCCWDTFRLPSSIVRGPIMPMQMVCPASAASARLPGFCV